MGNLKLEDRAAKTEAFRRIQILGAEGRRPRLPGGSKRKNQKKTRRTRRMKRRMKRTRRRNKRRTSKK